MTLKEATRQSLIKRYVAAAYTHNYIFGWVESGNVYMTITDSTVLPYIIVLDKASRGQGYSIRFRPNKAHREILKTSGTATILCSEAYFNEAVSASKYNKGETFEKMVTEYMGCTWSKDNVPFTKGGDIEADGIAYQVKFQGATFTNEASLAKLGA